MTSNREMVSVMQGHSHFAICSSQFAICNAPRQQKGISLLEVLFSMFVLAVGLLGLAAMVPVGKHQVTEASHADRSTAIGLAAHKEIKIRDLMDEAMWVYYNYAATNANKNLNYQPFTPSPNVPFIIDPLAVAGNVNSLLDAQYSYFPHGSANFPNPTAPSLPKMLRVSIRDLDTNLPAGVPLADRIFRSLDDRTFELPGDVTLRPRHMVDTTVVTPPGQFKPPLPTQSQSEGNYSWLIMVSPPAFEGGPNTVSVVVFYKRDLVVDTSAGSTPSERYAHIELVNGGLGGSFGGDAQFRGPKAAGTPSAVVKSAAEQFFKVRPNQWILISGQLSGSNTPVHKWYRVVSTSELQVNAADTEWVVDLTLSGPDWNASSFNDMDGTAGATMFATICDGVVGVFEKTVQLDEPSLWTSH